MPGEEELYDGLFLGLVGKTYAEYVDQLTDTDAGPGMTSTEAKQEANKIGANAKASAAAIITFINEVLVLSEDGALTVNLPEIPDAWSITLGSAVSPSSESG
jgi:hypothetical protein